MPAKARIPENLLSAREQAERKLITEMHASGELFKVHCLIADRLHAYETEIDHEQCFWIGGQKVSDNGLWCLLRRDVEASYSLPQPVLKRVMNISFAYIRKHTKTMATPGARVVVVSLRD